MICYFLRHGIAVAPGEWQGSDAERPLTPDGCKRMEREAKAIASLGLDIDLIVTSPLLRARQTAEFVADRLGLCDAIVDDERIAHRFNADACRAILADHPRANSVMLVGHEPAMSSTIGRLIGSADIELKKAALAGIELPDRNSTVGTLICLIPPKALVTLGRLS
ncbi:MAG TPA: histidine phosphatase family protein [Candidatus Cybelea sp.]|jgi:phosphohistidine phosphatase|nr:histidine phosphatase family protein [Candidatus Cybelea sp.]